MCGMLGILPTKVEMKEFPMSDNLRRYRAIKAGFAQLFETPPVGRHAQYLTVLTALVCGIVGSQHTHLSAIAAKFPSHATRESRIKRFTRFLGNDHIAPDVLFAPFARAVLRSLAHRPLVLVIDGSQVGKGCMALVISVVYHGRALPLAWQVVKAAKGHLAQEEHLALVRGVQPLVPVGASVVFVGDGEFDGTQLLAQLTAFGWQYVCRTAKNTHLWLGDDRTSFDNLALTPGDLVVIANTVFQRTEYGPITAIAVWETDADHPLYLVTTLDLAGEALAYYRTRFRIETLFSDHKTRGFRLDKSHLTDPARLGRLLLATCVAYLWLVYLGTTALLEGWSHIIHRTDRCDLSLFALGLRLLDHFLEKAMPIPVAFVPFWLEDDLNCVR